jgi:hypothetical protein
VAAARRGRGDRSGGAQQRQQQKHEQHHEQRRGDAGAGEDRASQRVARGFMEVIEARIGSSSEEEEGAFTLSPPLYKIRPYLCNLLSG